MEAIKKFLIEIDEDTYMPSIESHTVIEACKFNNWLRGKQYEVYYGMKVRDRIFKSIDNAVRDYRESIYINGLEVDYTDFTPVGSVEYCDYILNKLTGKHIKPINIPRELIDNNLVHRKVAIVNCLDEVDKFIDTLESKKVFIKPNEHCKKFDGTMITSSKDLEYTDDSYLVSEPVEFITEWRVLVFRGNIVYFNSYLHDNIEDIVKIDLDYVKEIINTYSKSKNSSKAYTLDIGLRSDGIYDVVEMNNFISCGLYGFEGSQIPMMIQDAWNFELTRTDN